jgi:hypothetical protein
LLVSVASHTIKVNVCGRSLVLMTVACPSCALSNDAVMFNPAFSLATWREGESGVSLQAESRNTEAANDQRRCGVFMIPVPVHKCRIRDRHQSAHDHEIYADH